MGSSWIVNTFEAPTRIWRRFLSVRICFRPHLFIYFWLHVESCLIATIVALSYIPSICNADSNKPHHYLPSDWQTEREMTFSNEYKSTIVRVHSMVYANMASIAVQLKIEIEKRANIIEATHQRTPNTVSYSCILLREQFTHIRRIYTV